VLARTVTHALVGLEPRRVEVEAHLQRGVPAFAIVGLADRACQEAKERVRSGITSAELEWPLRRITVNLAPADLRKEGSGFDLPIALAVLAASRQFPPGALAGHAAIGELALDGRLRPVPGALAAAEGARRHGSRRLVCAAESGAEVALAGIEPVPVHHLAEAVVVEVLGDDERLGQPHGHALVALY
jgi:magnesium chelatase family protein